MAINKIDKDHPLYCFGFYGDEQMPRALVTDDLTNWRPATTQEFKEHHEEMAKNILLDRHPQGEIGKELIEQERLYREECWKAMRNG